MLIRTTIILTFFTFQFLYTNAQSYLELYDICSKKLDLIGTDIDSLYFVHLGERNICLEGSIAPYFSATSIDGRNFNSDDLRGKVIVMNFWFTKCQPCIAEIPALNKLVDSYSEKDVTFISFTYEDQKKLQLFLEKHPFAFANVANSDSIRRDIFKLFSIWPYTVIIDRKGKISKMILNSNTAKTFEMYKEAIDKAL